MNKLDFKIQIICDISFLNEKSVFLEELPSNKEEIASIKETLNQSLKERTFDNDTLVRFKQDEFAKIFYQTIIDLKKWVEEDIYLSWEEDDTNFLNFLLHSRWLYEERMLETYSSYISLLFNEVIVPLFMKTSSKNQFFNDMSYWFVTEGDSLLGKLDLQEERKELSEHFEKENFEK